MDGFTSKALIKQLISADLADALTLQPTQKLERIVSI
jgi:hypothetical protein